MNVSKKKILAIALTVLLLTPLHTFAEDEIVFFSDVKPESSYFVAINTLKQENALQGFEDGSFHPTQPIKRIEAIKMLLTSFDMFQKTKDITVKTTFTDTQEKSWYTEYLNQAVKNGIIEGYQNNTFRPENTLNRAEGLKIAIEAFHKKFPGIEIQNADTIKPFTDEDKNQWYAPYTSIAKSLVLLEFSTKNRIYPDEDLTRGEFAAIIYKLRKTSEQTRFGTASYYSDSLHGRNTSSGEPYNKTKFTAAHLTLPFGTKILVTNLKNGKNVEVTVNDRGPFTTGLDIDLSRAAFGSIAYLGEGIIEVEYTIIP